MTTALEAIQELEIVAAELEKDIAALELAVTAFIGVQFGNALDVDASLGFRKRVRFITATIKLIT
jgi:chorismate synthase